MHTTSRMLPSQVEFLHRGDSAVHVYRLPWWCLVVLLESRSEGTYSGSRAFSCCRERPLLDGLGRSLCRFLGYSCIHVRCAPCAHTGSTQCSVLAWIDSSVPGVPDDRTCFRTTGGHGSKLFRHLEDGFFQLLKALISRVDVNLTNRFGCMLD